MKDGAAMRRTIRKACTGTKNILVIAAAVFAVCVHSSGYTQAAEIHVSQAGGGWRQPNQELNPLAGRKLTEHNIIFHQIRANCRRGGRK